MIDTHCHLDLPVFAQDRDAVLVRARQAGVETVVVPAIRPSTFSELTHLSDVSRVVKVALGIHPQVVPDLTPVEKRALLTLPDAILAAGAIAVGECGLDGATGDHDEQERLFRAQIRIARDLKLPLLVHVLRAHDWAPRILREENAAEVGGIMHSYSGGADLVPVYRDLGFAFSFAGPITYHQARRPIAAARAVPAELLLVETDGPDQAPEPYRGTRCEPAYLRATVEALGRARDLSYDDIRALTTANARRVLGLGTVLSDVP